MLLLFCIADNLCRISNNNRVVRNILCHNRASTYNHVITDGDTRKNDTVSAKPHIVTDGDRFSIDIVGNSCLGIHRVVDGIQTGLWTHQTVIADGDRSHIQHYTLEICKKVLADMDMKSVVTVERRFDKNIIIAVTK